jgi:hypothetical protein
MEPMDSFALGYLAQRFVYRIGDFLRHWYIKSVRIYWNAVMNWLQEIDRTLAWRITAQNLFSPLYGDFSPIGYVFGFLFRFIRLAIGGVVYVVLFGCAALAYAVWVAIPPYLILRAFII